jgi:TrmH family RNA methyltransferase
MEALSDPKNPRLRRYRELLREAKARRAAGCFVVEGPKLAEEALAIGIAPKEWLATPAFMERHAGLAARLRKACPQHALATAAAFERVSDAETPQGVMLCLPLPDAEAQLHAWRAAPGECVVAAQGLQDPGNLGTLMRSAKAVGASAILLSEGCADAWAPKALRAGAGAQLGFPVFSGLDLAQEISLLNRKGFMSLALAAKGSKRHTELKYNRPVIVLVGSEGKGLPEALVSACTHSVKIWYSGSVESLNAGVAGTILLFEILRQRQIK